MIGPIAFFPRVATIASGAIDISNTTDEYSSRIIIGAQTGTTDDLDTITGANHAGQILILQAIATHTITIKHGTDNFRSATGSDIVLQSQDNILLIFDAIANEWTNLSPISDLTASGSGANTALSNLITTAINETLLPDTTVTYDLGSGSANWHNVFLENARFVSGGTGVGGAGQIYRDANGMYLNFPTGKKFFLQENAVDKWDFTASTLTGSNIILSNTFTLNDSSGDPLSAGQFTRNSADVKVFTGGGVVNLTDVGSGSSGANITLSNLTADGVNANTHIEPAASATSDLGQGDAAWRDLFVSEVRFTGTTTATAGGMNIAVEALTPDTMVLNVGTNEDWLVMENGDDTDPLMWIDTSANKLTLAGGITLFVIAANGGGNLFSITKSASNQAIFDAGSDGYKFNSAAVEFTNGFNITAAGGTADFNANNLIDTGNVIPNADSTQDLGSSTNAYLNLWSDRVRFPNQAALVVNAWNIGRDLSDNLEINVPTNSKINFAVNGVTIFDIDSSDLTGNNIILSNTLTVNDSSVDPVANGQFTRNGTNVKVMTGGVVKSLTDIGTGSSGITFPVTPTIKDHSTTWTNNVAINLSATDAHIQKITLDANLIWATPSNPPSSGTQIEFEIEYVQDATGGWTVTQWSEVVETVNVSLTANAVTIVTYRTNDGGSNYHAVPSLRGSINLSGVDAANKQLDNLGTTAVNADINMGNNDVAGIGTLLFTNGNFGGGAAVSYISSDVSGDLILNVADADQFQLAFQNSLVWAIDKDKALGNAIILTDSITLNDAAAEPAVAGEMQRSGDDVFIFTGGSSVNLTNSGISDKIEEGNSKVEVVDTGTGSISFSVDATSIGTMTTTFGLVMDKDIAMTTNDILSIGNLTFNDGNTLITTATRLTLTQPAITDDFHIVFGSPSTNQWDFDTESLVMTHTSTMGITVRNEDATPTDTDSIFTLNAFGDDSANNDTFYGRMIMGMKNVTSTIEAGLISFGVLTDGEAVPTIVIQVEGSASSGTKIGFFNTTPAVQQTGVAVSASAIHTALVNLGLITA